MSQVFSRGRFPSVGAVVQHLRCFQRVAFSSNTTKSSSKISKFHSSFTNQKPIQFVVTRSHTSFGSDLKQQENSHSQTLLRDLRTLRDKKDHAQFAKLLEQNRQNRNLSPNFSDDLLCLLTPEFIGTFKSMQVLSRLFRDLAKFGTNCTKFQSHLDVYLLILNKLDSLWAGVSDPRKVADFISNILTGCANAHLKWYHLDSERQLTLQMQLLFGLESSTGREFANNLHSLQKMGAKWSDLHVDLQKEIIKRLVKLGDVLDAQQRSMCFYSLGSLGLVFSDCDLETQSAISDIARKTFNSKIDKHVGQSSQFTQQQSNTFIGLTLMGMKRSEMDAALIRAIDHSLQFNLGYGDPQQLPNTIHSLSKLGFQWKDFSSDVTSAIQKAIVSEGPKFNRPQHIANTLYGLGVMGSHYSDLTADAQNALLVSFEKFNAKLTEQELSNTVYGFGKMGATRSTLSSQATKSLITACIRCFPTMPSQEVSNVLYGFYLMGMEWHRVNPEFQDSAYTALVRVFSHKFNEQNLSNSLLALASMGVSWDSLPSEVRNSLINAVMVRSENFTVSQDINNTRYSIALMTFDTQDLKSPELMDVFDSLAKHGVSSNFSLEDASQSAVFYELMSVLKPNTELIDILNVLSVINLTESSTTSNIHLKFAVHLTKCLLLHSEKFTVKNEFVGLKSGVFPLDCAVYRGDVLVAFMEIDGSHHYTSDGALTREGQFKTWLYARHYPGVPLHRVKNIVNNKVGIAQSAEELAKKIVGV